MKIYDVTIVGGGIVGLATAWQLLKHHPQLSVLVMEKEPEIAMHQTGHNSGVIHSGIYYQPGSLRAINCRKGKKALEQFCRDYEIPFETCGKVIVATDSSEIDSLERVYQRGAENEIECELITQQRLSELEPQVSGVAAIEVPETGIIDYREVAKRLSELIKELGGTILCQTKLEQVAHETAVSILKTTQGEFATRLTVTCPGLYSDRVARMCGATPKTKIVPFRGEYFKLKPNAKHLCRNLIYPVPNPQFPFLGVHFTRMIDGEVECGPNAVLAFSRQGYQKANFNLGDLFDSVSYTGFRKLCWKHWQAGVGEMWRSVSKTAFVNALKKLIPEIRAKHLIAAPAGVRAQVVSQQGELVDDFVIETSPHGVHVLNAPSPAATASLNIGKTILEKITPLL